MDISTKVPFEDLKPNFSKILNIDFFGKQLKFII